MKTLFVLIALLLTHLVHAQPCGDTSFRKWYYAPLDTINTVHQFTTASGGALLVGQYLPRTAAAEGLAVNLDGRGNLLWSKRYQPAEAQKSMILTRGMALSDGHLLLAGRQFKKVGLAELDNALVLLKTDSKGNVIWKNAYAPEEATSPVYITSVRETSNGDLLVMGTRFTTGQQLAIFRLDATGNLQWSRSLGSDNTEFMSLMDGFQEGADILVWANGNEGTCSSDSRSLTVFRLDFGSGELKETKEFCLTSSDAPPFFASYVNQYKAKKVGAQYYIYGLLGEAQNDFALYRFDASLRFLDGRAFFQSKNQRSFQLYLDDSGSFSFLQQQGAAHNRTLYFSTLNPDFSPNVQRQLNYTFSGLHNFAYEGGQLISTKASGATAFALNYYNNAISTSVIEVLQVAPGLSASEACLGEAVAFEVQSTSRAFSLETVGSYRSGANLVTQKELDVITVDAGVQQLELCTQVSLCDTLRIQGADTVCLPSGRALFTAFKNGDCSRKVSWELDAYLIDSSYTRSDTLVLFFTAAAQPYTVWLSASIPSGCGTIKDSLKVTVMPPAPSLPRDTTLCAGDSLRLTAGSWSRRYLWQDGSSDSTYTVSAPGTYFVQTESFCGNITSDTIHVNMAKLDLQAGAALACVGDTLTLRATPGLSAYSWLAGSEEIASTDSVIQVLPMAATTYKVRAKTVHGCTVTSEVLINPLIPQRLNLGRDTAICEGNRITLDAGAGFSSYAWNTGAETATIAVGKGGPYSLIVTDAQGCRSRDTLNLTVHPILDAFFAAKEVLCKGQNDTLHAPAGLSYLWHDGSRLQSHPVHAPGTYWVQVRDANGCQVRDTANITALAAPPQDFIVRDTTFCGNQPLQLRPTRNFASYLWNTGSTQHSLNVQSAGSYSLKVWDQQGCMGAQTIQVIEKPCGNLMLFPSAFSPNRDGNNEWFKPHVKGNLLHYNMSIFDRWGAKVFATTDISKGWNGTIKGRQQSTGIYIWRCTYQFQGEEIKVQKGTVAIVQ